MPRQTTARIFNPEFKVSAVERLVDGECPGAGRRATCGGDIRPDRTRVPPDAVSRLEHGAERAAIVDARDGLGEKRGDGEDLDLRRCRRQRDRVGDEQPLEA